MTRAFVPSFSPPLSPPADALWFAVRGREVLVLESGEAVAIPRLPGLNAVGLEPGTSHYLGTLGGVACYAAHVVEEAEAPEGMAFRPLRPVLLGLEEELAGVAGLAFQIVDWDRTHRFCGCCGTPTEHAAGERAKRCPSCGLHAWPRVSPAVIVRVTRGDEILLARGRRFAEPVYSVLAGFVDPGESLEEAVAREVREEVGVDVEDVRYFGSQPWPFPHSLMVGFTARWAGGEIRIDEAELVDAGWFGAESLPAVPPKLSIARKLIDDFVARASRSRSDDGKGASMPIDPDRLKGLALFAGLSAEERATIAGWLSERQTSEGQRLTPEGASGYTFFIIEEGAAEVSKDGGRIGELGPGDFFGEIAILGTGRRMADVVATSPMRLLALFGTEFRRLEAEFPQVVDRIKETVRERSQSS